MFANKHKCSVGLDSYDMLPNKLKAGWCNKLTMVSEYHPLTFEHIRSYPMMVAERQRQILEGEMGIIHPFSLFTLIWNSIMVFVNIPHMVLSSLRLCYFLNPLDRVEFHELDYVLLALNIMCFIDVAIRFNTGYLEGSPAVVVLYRRSIACNYLRCGGLLDLVSCIPVTFIFLVTGHRTCGSYLIAHGLPILRVLRLSSIMANLKIFLLMLTRSYIFIRVVHHCLVFALLMHWFTCFIYLPPVFYYYYFGYIPNGYNSFLRQRGELDGDITDVEIGERYKKAMFISVSAFIGTGFSMFTVSHPAEIMVNSIIILSAAMFMIYTMMFCLRIYMTAYNSSMRYQELLNQVEKYMRHKQFPAPLKKRVRSFYDYRYQERYFKEETAFRCLPEQLRDEITLHTCQDLLNQVALFDSITPALIGTLIGCLKLEVFLPNDLIVRAGDFGDCMFFISSGSVAVYSMKGAEVCHLEDGDYFGEIALLLKDRKRIASVVAIEITQVYRLDVDDFRSLIMTNAELLSRIKSESTRRINLTVMVDDAYRRERERRATSGSNKTTSDQSRTQSGA